MTSTEKVDDIHARLTAARDALLKAEADVSSATARRDMARRRYEAILREKRGQAGVGT